jgi:hypothetical protein
LCFEVVLFVFETVVLYFATLVKLLDYITLFTLVLLRSIDVNPVKNNETQQRKGTQDRSKDRFEWKNLDPLFMTNKNLGIRKTPQTVVEIRFDKSR